MAYQYLVGARYEESYDGCAQSKQGPYQEIFLKTRHGLGLPPDVQDGSDGCDDRNERIKHQHESVAVESLLNLLIFHIDWVRPWPRLC